MMQRVDIELNPDDSTEDKVSAVFDALTAGGMPVAVAARVAESLVNDLAERKRLFENARLMQRNAQTMFALSAVLFGLSVGLTVANILRWLAQ